MNYQETIEYLYNITPLFQNVGKAAYKEGLDNTLKLDAFFEHPHKKFKTIHIAGTNGKGSCSHTIAAILQSAGYKTGLYTSPHLVDFSERIRVNGNPIEKDFVVKFVEENKHFFEPLHPSFFELTTSMAFLYFAHKEVDVAVIEVGLGGRLDCTNVIHPDLSIITNISFDHTQFLGHTLSAIASEKAGIIKENTPVIIGEYNSETREVFENKARQMNANIIFAEDSKLITEAVHTDDGHFIYQSSLINNLYGELCGNYQLKNTNTILNSIIRLKDLGYKINEQNIREGFKNVCQLTGLMGRWQKLEDNPTIICDTGHNIGGIGYITEQLSKMKYDKLHIVIGMVNDKDINGVISLLPENAVYYFTQASVKRALPAEEIKKIGNSHGLKGEAYKNVKEALYAAKQNASEKDMIFVGGSTFIVADLIVLYSIKTTINQ
ncbi:bifunctional folylpolyglutamate synthase/dihydrofolate synthase [Bacteroides caecigallinarum]|uniref:bifunctional folylpolyglutamate synthase/dihydrofolate synthase n=1 Tax=Bacteroides caecigallinarum TaxID=1411144 RepID=UPI001F46D501|nr:folylpolyglutamate synthase/dihydrofolate synthase family protein [Bacteroides caecigallinarum]MCF2594258.1 bifunctional folylpolyglutamate synthase/dihydrofolate synthase [Bacteroides caecigallinarum]